MLFLAIKKYYSQPDCRSLNLIEKSLLFIAKKKIKAVYNFVKKIN